MKTLLPLQLALLLATFTSRAAEVPTAVRARVDAEYPSLLALYQHLHANPEISFQEVQTADRIAARSEEHTSELQSH